MFSKAELKLLSDISRGNDTTSSLIRTADISAAQIYSLLGSLRKKEILRLENGKIILENKTHITLLVNILHRSYGSYEPLSGHGMDILGELMAPRTAEELAERLEIHQTTVSRKIREMMNLSMIRKERGKFFINRQLWQDLPDLADAFVSYKKNNDPRVIPGSKIYFNSKDLVVFSNDSNAEYTKTAFSAYSGLRIEIILETNYYCVPERILSVSDVFLHSLYVISRDGDWWLKMMALIFYVKFADELKEIRHPIKDEMNVILSGSRIPGWVPLEEMRERADMYGVRL